MKILLLSVGKHEQPDELIDCKIFDLYYLPKFNIWISTFLAVQNFAFFICSDVYYRFFLILLERPVPLVFLF